MTHRCVGNLTILGSDNGLSPYRRQAIIWTNAKILLIGHIGTNFSEISIEILTFSFKKMRLEASSAIWRPFCLGLNVLTPWLWYDITLATTNVRPVIMWSETLSDHDLHNVWAPILNFQSHYDDVIMGAIASQITTLTIVYSTVYSGADQSKHQSSASLAFVRGIHRGPVNSPHKWPVTRKMFPFDDVIMLSITWNIKWPR